MSDVTLLAKKLHSVVQYYSTEIGLQTYGRKPHELLQTEQWWKLQQAEKFTRKMRDEVFNLVDDIKRAAKKESV